MKAETKKKLQFLMELGLNQNEINELLDSQEMLDQSQEFKKEEVEEEDYSGVSNKEEKSPRPLFLWGKPMACL